MNGRASALLHRNGFQPKEYLLAALGEATGVCPPVEKSLRHPTPTRFSLDTAGANAFLTEQAWLLEQAGFGVLVPPWSKHAPRLGLRLRARPRPVIASGANGIGLAGLCDYRYEVDGLGTVEFSVEG